MFRLEEIWNLDETDLMTVMFPTRAVAPKGGTVPPVFVFTRIRNPVEYLGDENSASAIAFGNKRERITSEVFPEVIKHFVSHVKCTQQNRVLLLVDNHESHISVEVIRLCRENGIVLLSFLPHTTHRLQPLDAGVYGPFKTYLAAAHHHWLLTNPAKVIAIRYLGALAKRAL
ncbi:uncharacterized protein [Diabrotica undecimpunctata]|uniref:uncharacterized protein n=1 Tax=Diabrotica undecimpunctata TaxID=50387 RepID=UPI003B636A1F